MTEFERAIDYLQPIADSAAIGHYGEMLKVALSALREAQEREKGCEYCRERKPILDGIGMLQIDDSDSTLWFTVRAAADDIYEDHTKIKFCPMCGRRLKEGKAE